MPKTTMKIVQAISNVINYTSYYITYNLLNVEELIKRMKGDRTL